MFTQISSIVENVCVFKEEASSTDPNCAVEKLSVSLQSCEPFCITDIDSSERLSASDISRTNVIVGAFNSIRIAESSEKADRFDDASEIKRPGILCSTSRKRGTCMTKLNQKTETKKAARRCRKAANKNQWLDSIFSKVARRRRSCFCKRARSSGWGLLGNIAQVFQQNAGPDINQNVHKKLQKSRVGREGRKQNKSQTGRSSQRSNGKDTVSTSRIRLKVKLGKEVGQSCLMDTVSVINNDLEKSWGTKREFPKLNRDIEGKLEEEVHRSTGFQCCHRNLNKTIMLSDASVLDVNVADKYTIKKLAGNCADNHHGIPSQEEVVGLGVTVDNRCLDAGTSPDSEVINFTPEAQISGEVPEDLHDVLIPSQDWVSHGDVTSLSLPDTGNKEGEKKNKHRLAGKGNCNVDGRLPSPEITNNVILFEKYGEGEKMGDDFYSSEASLLTMAGNASGNTCSCEGFSMEPLPSSRVTDFGVSTVTLKNESRAEVDLCSKTAVRLESPESQISEKLLPCSLPKGQKLPKSSGSRGVTKGRKEVPDSVSRRGNACGRKGTKDMLVHKRKVKVDCDGGLVVGEVGCCPETGNHTLDDCGETKPGCRSTVEEISNLDMVPTVMRDQYVRPRNAWVCCDDCFKWRRIAAALADSIEETNSRWICRDNMDKNLADCSVPQEKSNAEINAELEISDGEEDAFDARLNPSSLPQNQLTVPKQSSWKLIRSNLFLHRTRKTQTIDEIMVCNCKAPLDGRMGCGDGCLNRMLNIECVKGTCPCGELCSNQQFQKRKYAKLKCFPSGKKGHGLHLVEDIPKGRFLIEYVGEVLDIHAYGARQREYASKGHKHFYFMTLNGSEVIDACAKGNLGRFVNHSCEPNCRTEKWMVNGEVCIGLFAVRDIKKDEEVTFDYNYVRVFGAAAKKCVCGSSQCRGYIGGDPLNADIIVQGDSDEEYPEPLMVYEDCETNLDNTVSVTSSFSGTEIQTAENLFKNKDYMHKSGTAVGDLKNNKEMRSPEILLEYKDEIDDSTAAVGYIENTTENEDSMKRSSSVASKLEISSEMESSVGVLPFSAQRIENSLQPDDGNSEITSAAQQELSVAEETTKRNLCTVQRVENYLTTTPSKLLPETVDIKRKSKPGMEEDRCVVSKSHPRVKTSRSSSSVKKGKSKNNAVNVNKPAEMDNKSHRSKKLLEGSSNGHFEAVQEKLNELIDADGGISKRKDASRGYLQLLFLTAASGDSGNGEAIQSNRDLSMILGALLKTKSRTVLVDIIDKNGLQMLHNIMKRYRREFNKIPILRKLLKVLEYLAVREILTLEHINRGPPCTGVESFRESILTLTDHNDKQVHQIARKFRDRWISRPFKNYSCMDREGGRMEFHRGAKCNRFSASRNHASDRSGIATEAVECVKKSVIATTPVCSTSYSSSSVTNGTKTRKRKTRWDSDVPRYKELKTEPSLLENRVDDGSAVMDEDVPPGFSPPLNGLFVPPNSSSSTIAFHQENGPTKSPCEVVMGQLQDRYVSGLPISYGIPLSVVHQFGTSQEEESIESWVVAPGMPFHSFPPLPPYPRGKKGAPPNSLTMNLTAAEKDEPTYRSDANTPSTSGASQPSVEIPCPHNFQRARGSSNSLGRRFFRQQKWNYSKFPPPWIRNRNGWGFMGNNSINGSYNTGVGSVESRPKGPYSTEEESIGVQSYGNTFYQQPQHQNYH